MYQSPKRRKLTKAERQFVYDKCGGHCAYCGCEITMRQMQIMCSLYQLTVMTVWTTCFRHAAAAIITKAQNYLKPFAGMLKNFRVRFPATVLLIATRLGLGW